MDGHDEMVTIDLDLNEEQVNLLLVTDMAKIADDGVLELTELGSQVIMEKVRECEAKAQRDDRTNDR